MRPADALQAKRALKAQALLGFIAALLALPFGAPVALSVLTGAGACLLANALFAVWVFRGYRAQEPERLLLRLYAAEVGKIALLLGLFAIAYAMIDGLSVPALLGGYLLAQVVSMPLAARSGGRV